MYKVMALVVTALSVLTATALGSIGGNLTVELKPEIIGQINQTDTVVTPAELNFWMRERTLWQERVFWTRMAINSILQDSDDRVPVLNRLLRNYEDMKETIAPFYGNETAGEYGELIRTHLLITAQLAEAVREENRTAFLNAEEEWYRNADEIANLESTLSSNLSLKDRKAMWYENLNLTRDETLQLYSKDYSASIDTFDRLEEQANIMADSLANGIILEFAKWFNEDR